MVFSFSPKKKERIVAIFDIGSGSIGGALVKLPATNTGVPIIIKSISDIEIKSQKDIDFDTLLKNMSSALYQTAHLLYSKRIAAPEEIYCVMASPWYLSETRVIKLSKEKPFIFTKRLADELIQKEVVSLSKVYNDKYGNSEGAPELIEQNTMAVSLNGYKIEDPLGKKCQSLEMDMFISLSPKLCLNKIREALSKVFHHTEVNFSSFTMASYLAVRDKYISQDSYLLIDIGGEITDVGIVSKGVLRSVLSFPFGKRTLYSQLCSKLEIELRDAKELFRLYSEDNLSATYKKKVEPIFNSIEEAWNLSFNECVSTLPRTLVLPDTIFLTADNDIKEWFAGVLRNEKYVQSTGTDRKCAVITLDGPEFLNMCDIKDGVCNPFLMIESIATTRKIVK